MSKNYIEIKNARIHNLRNVNVSIPKNKLTVITGVSGSGKSSLAFDTLYEEGKRRYLMFSGTQFMVDSVPSFDSITGLSPTVAVEQRIIRQANPRSTVGTRVKISALLAALLASQGQREICQSPRVGEAMLALKDFMFESVYTNQLAKGEEGKAQDMLRRLFEYYQKDPDRLPGDFQAIRMEEGVDRAVCDYIAGMTDPFAVERFKELFIPKGWTVL